VAAPLPWGRRIIELELFRRLTMTPEEVNEELAHLVGESSWEPDEPTSPRDPERGAATVDNASLWNATTTHGTSPGARIAPSFSDFIDMLNLQEPSRLEE